MNKKNILILIIAVSAVLFSSCSGSDEAAEALLTKIWEYDESSASYPAVNYEFKADGTARMIGFDVDDAGEQAILNWKADGYHLELTDMLLLYSCAYVYELSDGGDTLDLYCTAVGLMNISYDSISPGMHITLKKSDVDFLQELAE